MFEYQHSKNQIYTFVGQDINMTKHTAGLIAYVLVLSLSHLLQSSLMTDSDLEKI